MYLISFSIEIFRKIIILYFSLLLLNFAGGVRKIYVNNIYVLMPCKIKIFIQWIFAYTHI